MVNVNGLPRVAWEHQIDVVKEFWDRHAKGYRGNMLAAPPGTGKTRIVMQYVAEKAQRLLAKKGAMPRYWIYTGPLETFKTVIAEAHAYGIRVQILDPHQNSKIRRESDFAKMVQKSTAAPQPFTMTLIEHDHLRDLKHLLLPVMHQAFFTVDEAHKALSDTKRTQTCLELSHMAQEFLNLY